MNLEEMTYWELQKVYQLVSWEMFCRSWWVIGLIIILYIGFEMFLYKRGY